MTEIKTNAHTLIVVPVPEDARNFEYIGKTLFFISGIGLNTLNHDFRTNLDGKYLGSITTNEIDFDATPYVEKGTIIYSQDNSPYYSAPDKSGTLSEQSFRTLLQSHNIHFENPLGKEPRLLDKKYSIADGMMQHTNPYQKDLKKWQFAQSKVISKAVMLLKK